MSFEIEGILVKKYEVENKTSSFQTREFVISTEGNYPQFVKFQLTQDKCQIIDSYNEGDKIKVLFDLRGREWQGKYFTNLNAWKVDIAKSVETEQMMSGEFPPVFDTQSSKATDELPETFDDLPF